MRYEAINPTLFTANRARLAAKLDPNSVAVVNSNDVLPTNGDATLPLKQNSDMFYLTGVDQEESVLLLFPDAPDPKQREILFVRETSERIAIWEGQKLTKEKAREVSGIENVQWLDRLPSTLRDLAFAADQLYLNSNEHNRAPAVVETRDDRFIAETKRRFPLHTLRRLAPILHELRMVKHDIELAVMRRACDITDKGFRRILGFTKPGVWEYEIEAELIHEFIRHGSKGFAYTPIIASGLNSCVLHYLDNDQRCEDGDVVLLDVAAEYANYQSDLTRTIPANGRFTKRQRAVYEAVLRVMREALTMLQPGVLMREYQKEVEKLMESELLGLDLISKKDIADQDPDKPAFKKYFMHGVSHHIGLDVHDVANANRPIEENMVFTVEPGIYIRDEKLGIRLENDVVVKSGGNVDLMADIPVEAEEIEELMNAG